MRSQRPSFPVLAIFMALFLVGPVSAVAQTFPDYLPARYRPFFNQFVDARSLPEQMLNVAGLTSKEYGHGFALIAGVSRYPRITGPAGNLVPAAEDIRKLQSYLKYYEKIDEIVVLTDEEMTADNLYFFLARYFPRRLREFPRSRFLFAYSGHGMTENGKGFLLTSEAVSLSDTFNAIPMTTVRAEFQQVIDAGFHVLALINACYSGDFIKRSFGDDKHFIPRYGGAHAITAGGTKELTWHDASVGTGSVFFEKFFAALDGRAGRGGIVTVDDLAAYLRREVQISTEQNQNPLPGDLSRDGSLGGFFFFNRRPLVEEKVLQRWDQTKGVPYGVSTSGESVPEPSSGTAVKVPDPGAMLRVPVPGAPSRPASPAWDFIKGENPKTLCMFYLKGGTNDVTLTFMKSEFSKTKPAEMQMTITLPANKYAVVKAGKTACNGLVASPEGTLKLGSERLRSTEADFLHRSTVRASTKVTYTCFQERVTMKFAATSGC
jgi:Caspase domain